MKNRKFLNVRSTDDGTVALIDLGKGHGVFEVPKAVADYIEDIAQENYAITTRLAESDPVARRWQVRPYPKILSFSKGK